MKDSVLLHERMTLFCLDAEELSKRAFVDKATIVSLLDGKTSFDEIDEFDMQMIEGVLYCTPGYFINQEARNKDLIRCSLNRGEDNAKSLDVKGRLQTFISDFIFIERASNQ